MVPDPEPLPNPDPEPQPEPQPEPTPPPQPSPALKERRVASFTADTGLSDEALLAAYEKADRNEDDYLSWSEIRRFQRDVYRDYAYVVNHTALDPVQFFARRGGDCEDFSLYTCGLLRYWNIDCWVGIFGRRGGDRYAISHAVMFMAVDDVPA